MIVAIVALRDLLATASCATSVCYDVALTAFFCHRCRPQAAGLQTAKCTKPCGQILCSRMCVRGCVFKKERKREMYWLELCLVYCH